jgi:hypothetical protein
VNKNKALLLSLQLQLISQPQEVRRLSNSLPISSKRLIQPCPRGHQSVPGRYVNRTEPCHPYGCPAMQRAFLLTSSFYLTGHILYACPATDPLRLIPPSISSESLAQRGMLARCYQFHVLILALIGSFRAFHLASRVIVPALSLQPSGP